MDGVPVGRHMTDVEAVARALGIAWDQTTVERFGIIEQAWLKQQHAQLAAKRKNN